MSAASKMTDSKGRRLLSLHRGGGSGSATAGSTKQGPIAQPSRISSSGNLQKDTIQEDIDNAPVLSPASPGTPQKKVWERQYRSFLHRKHRHGQSHPDELATPAVPPPLVPRPSTEVDKATIDILKQSSRNHKGKGEGSVRGGNLFGHIFRKDNNNGKDVPTPPVRRRVKSMSASDLDGTIRNGVVKGQGSPVSTGGKAMNGGALHHSLRGVSISTSALQQFRSHPQLRPRIATEELEDDSLRSDDWTQQSSDRSTPPLPFPVWATAADTSSLRGGREFATTFDPLDQPLASSSAVKKAFTEFHNAAETGVDSVSAFLGEDSSLHDMANFWPQKSSRMPSSASHGTLPKLLENFSQDHVSEERMLRPVIGVNKWQQGRRYLIAPAALAACHPSVSVSLKRDMVAVDHATDDTGRFGTIFLGKCLLSYDPEAQSWSSASLVLRQNYLLEFDGDMQHPEPRGYSHLQYSVTYAHPNYADILELHFYGSPCAKSDRRVLLIRVEEKDRMDEWMQFLNRAASLTVEDIYEIQVDSLGKGQYSTVHKATRRGSTEEVAIKFFDKNQFWRLVVKGIERADTLVRECSVQATLTSRRSGLHSFIHLRGFFETSDHIALEMELLDGTDLFKHISSKGVLPEPEAARILAELLRVIVAMNEVGLSHRDIKPANVLMCRPDDSGRIKLCDFGMSTFVGVDGLVRGRCGTPGKFWETLYNMAALSSFT